MILFPGVAMGKPLLNIIIGLGNHAFLKTRHSIGMVVCDQLASYYDASWEYKRKYKAYTTCIVTPPNNHFYLMKSTLPMNINGKSLLKAVRDLDVSPDGIVLLHDDLDRDLGKISWKLEGSAGGHNGVKSVISSLRDNKIKRLRIGIGRPPHREQVTDYVLEEFRKEDQQQVYALVDKAVQELISEVICTPPHGDDENTERQCKEDW